MTFQITANGRARTVEVSRTADTFHVAIDGHRQEVDVKVIDGVLSLLVGTRSYEISMGPAAADGSMMVHVDGTPVEVAVATSRPSGSSRGHAAPSNADAAGPHRVTAPMPGKIVKLLVKPGDSVEARQGLVVVEAMKMENELRARAAGTVVEVRVREGASVEAGAILVVIE